MNEVAESELVCPRCGEAMERGFVDGGKGPVRWVLKPNQNFWILGGDQLVKQHWWWGRHVIPGARCSACQIVVLAYTSPAS